MASPREQLARLDRIERLLSAVRDRMRFAPDDELGLMIEFVHDAVRRRRARLRDEVVRREVRASGAEMTRDEERWAEALAVERIHGARAAAYIAERIATLGSQGDVAGVERWTEIADRLDQLKRGGEPS